MKKILFTLVVLLIAGCAMPTQAATKKRTATKRTAVKKSTTPTYSLESLQGRYEPYNDGFSSPQEDLETYGYYVIKGNTLTFYEYDGSSFKVKFSTPFTLKRYTLACTKKPYGYQLDVDYGDCNLDGKIDLWMSDGMFWTKK